MDSRKFTPSKVSGYTVFEMYGNEASCHLALCETRAVRQAALLLS